MIQSSIAHIHLVHVYVIHVNGPGIDYNLMQMPITRIVLLCRALSTMLFSGHAGGSRQLPVRPYRSMCEGQEHPVRGQAGRDHGDHRCEQLLFSSPPSHTQPFTSKVPITFDRSWVNLGHQHESNLNPEGYLPYFTAHYCFIKP